MLDGSEISFLSKGIEDLEIEHQADVNPFTGAVVISVPLPLTPGRFGFGPSLSLQYNSSAGNSAYGVGWSLGGLPTIGLSLKQLPKYDGEDNFVFNGTDELVPIFQQDGDSWEPRVEELDGFRVHYYRSKVEGSYIRFERWVHRETGRIHWRSRDKDGVVSVYGLRASDEGRISDPGDPARTYLWLVEAQYDSNGNAVIYEYTKENAENIDISQNFERHRVLEGKAFAQRYLKRVHYGNTRPLAVDMEAPAENQWLFEVVFDYGDHEDSPLPSPSPSQSWASRPDPYSNHRPGFDVRTYRLCRRILMFHNFVELGSDPTLVRAIGLEHRQDAVGSVLEAIHYTGFKRAPETGEVSQRSLCPLRFEYSVSRMGEGFLAAPEHTKENFPSGLSDLRYRWVDLFGEGLPGILTETNQAWYYKTNHGEGNFGPQQKIINKPSQRIGSYTLSDFDRSGNLNLVVFQGRHAGYYEYDRDTAQWESFRPFISTPHIEAFDTKAQWLDLNGDGRPDIIVSKQDRFTWYPSKGKEGFDAPIELAKPLTNGASQVPGITEDLNLEYFFADMSGDGLIDQVRIQNGRVEYWPQLGNGRFGEGIVMEDPPVFDFDTEFDPGRLRLVDLDGSGTADLLYIGRGEIRYWINASGNRFVEGRRLMNLPYIDKLSTVMVLDFLGDGTPCLVWSSPLPGSANTPVHYLRLTDGIKPGLLLNINNSMGKEVRFDYSLSSLHYLRDKNAGRDWLSKLPSHTIVVDKKEVIDHIGGSRLVSRYEYHDGYFDSNERTFAGFGLVDQYDAEIFSGESMPPEHYTAPSCIRTWFHNGAFGWEDRRAREFYSRDPDHKLLPSPVFEELASLGTKEFEDGYRAIRGQMIRQEVFAVSANGQRAEDPYKVMQTAYRLRRLQPSIGRHDASFAFYQAEVLTYNYEQNRLDPRIEHHLILGIDPYGNALEECSVAYPRRDVEAITVTAQRRYYINASQHAYINIDETDRYEFGILYENKEYELQGLQSLRDGLFHLDDLKTELEGIMDTPIRFHEAFDPAVIRGHARLMGWDRNYYWNSGATAVLPLGQVGGRTLLHHNESACFDDTFITDVLDGRIEAYSPLLETDCRYMFRDDYWWRPGPVQHYLTTEGFCNLSRVERPDGGTIQYTYDPYFLALEEISDNLHNRIQANIDYTLIAPNRITDPNENISEVIYDPLGMIVVSTSHGNMLWPEIEPERRIELYGNDRLSSYSLQPEAGFADILAEPERFLQNMSQFFYYDLDTWDVSRAPLRSITLTREEFVHDGKGGGEPESRIQIALAYIDGFGRIIQGKQRIEPGPAIRRDSTGAILLNDEGLPEEEDMEERWLVSGHTVYNNKQQPVRQYEPFFSAIPDFEPDAELEAYGVSTYSHYDPIGRLVRKDMPNGTFTRIETTAWEVRQFDPNDTINDSLYRIMRESLPDTEPERQALNKAILHADTPTIIQHDPLGRPILKIETAGDGTEKITETRLDYQGNITAIIDPRGLTAFQYTRDMLGRIIYTLSIDAGETWGLPDASDQIIHQWDGRGVHKRITYDTLGRPVSAFVDGALGLNQITERMIYGEDPSVDRPELINARGRLFMHYDQAGVLTFRQYEPNGNPLRSERQLLPLNDCRVEPDWTDPAAVSPDPVPFISEVSYDALGRIREQSLPDRTTRSFSYLQSGGVNQVRVTTEDGVLTNEAILSESGFNARGQRTRSVLGNRTEITYTYDTETFRMNHLTARRPSNGDSSGGRTYQDIGYTYDPAGNLTHIVDHAQQQAPATAHVIHGLGVASDCDFTYDALYQLKAATGRVHQALLQHDYRPDLPYPAMKGTRHLYLNNGAAVERYTRTYDYDISGNIQRIHHQGLSSEWTTHLWTSASSNRSLPAEDPSGVHVTDPESRFDPNGNCTFMPHLRSMEWNYRNNLSMIIIKDRSSEGLPDDREYYIYGSDGMRVRKITERLDHGQIEITEKIYLDGCEIKRIHRGDQVVLERTTSHITDGVNRIALLYQWSQDRFARETDNINLKRTHYQLSNHLGSSSLEVNEEGTIISYEEYFPFGGTAFIAGDNVREVSLKDYRYSGKEMDDGTGLYYFGYRYYAPWIGNWLSPDPIGPEDSVNLYQYVLNNPVNLVDPNGLNNTRGTLYLHVGSVEELRPEYRNFQQLPLDVQLEILSPTGTLAFVPTSEGGRVVSRAEALRQEAELLSRGVDVHRPVIRETDDQSDQEETLVPGEYVFEEDDPVWVGDEEADVVVIDENAPPREADTEINLRTPTPNNGGSPDGNPGGAANRPSDPNATGNAHPADGSSGVGNTGGANTSEIGGRGTGLAGRGPGNGLRGTGRGGGGQNDRTGIGRRSGRGTGIAGGGTGFGVSESATGPGNGGNQGSSRSNMPLLAIHETDQGSETSTEPPEVGIPSQRSRTGNPEHLGLPPIEESQPAPPGLTINGDDPNGSPDGSRFGTRGSTGGPGSRREGTSAEGSPRGEQGSHGSSENGTRGTVLDNVVKWVGMIVHFEFGNGLEGESGGVPGGRDWLDLIEPGQDTQIAYIIGSILLEIITVILASGKAGVTALKQALRSLARDLTSLPGIIRSYIQRRIQNQVSRAIQSGHIPGAHMMPPGRTPGAPSGTRIFNIQDIQDINRWLRTFREREVTSHLADPLTYSRSRIPQGAPVAPLTPEAERMLVRRMMIEAYIRNPGRSAQLAAGELIRSGVGYQEVSYAISILKYIFSG